MTSHNPKRKINNKIVTYLWCIAISGVLVLFLHTYLTTPAPSESGEILNSTEQDTQTSKMNNLELTADEFKNNFNKTAKANKTDLEIKTLNFQKGLLQNTFQYMLTDDITLIGNVAGPNDTMQKITVLHTSTEASTPGSTINSVMTLLISAVNPTLSIAEQAKLCKELGLSTNQTVGDIEVIHDNKRYFYKPSDKLGTMFIISPTTF